MDRDVDEQGGHVYVLNSGRVGSNGSLTMATSVAAAAGITGAAAS